MVLASVIGCAPQRSMPRLAACPAGIAASPASPAGGDGASKPRAHREAPHCQTPGLRRRQEAKKRAGAPAPARSAKSHPGRAPAQKATEQAASRDPPRALGPRLAPLGPRREEKRRRPAARLGVVERDRVGFPREQVLERVPVPDVRVVEDHRDAPCGGRGLARGGARGESRRAGGVGGGRSPGAAERRGVRAPRQGRRRRALTCHHGVFPPGPPPVSSPGQSTSHKAQGKVSIAALMRGGLLRRERGRDEGATPGPDRVRAPTRRACRAAPGRRPRSPSSPRTSADSPAASPAPSP